MTVITDYPFGDGDKGCEKCNGRGVIPAPPRPGSVIVGGRTIPCPCVTVRDVIRNVERGWKGLSTASPIPSSPLAGKENQCLRITGTQKSIREHIRHVAIRQGTKWHFSVVSDADMMDSWLSRIDDASIIDADVEQMRRQPVTSKYGALVDLVEPPELLIVIAGVKAARNSAMPEVMLEALQHRSYLCKNTWIVDQPEYRMASGHISYSEMIGTHINKWPHIDLESKRETLVQIRKKAPPVNVQVFVDPHADRDEWLEAESEKLDNAGKKKWGKR